MVVRGEGEDDELDAEGEDDVLVDDGEGAARVADQPGELGEVVGHQGAVGGFDGRERMLALVIDRQVPMRSIIPLLMYKDPVYEARDAAAKATLEDMRRDRKQLPTKLRPLITYLVKHLFDLKLTATRAWKKAGIRDHTLSAAFREATGMTLRAYIERRRLEVADRMLRNHDGVGIMPISTAVGYESHNTFLAAYSRWLKESPSATRSKPRPPEIDYLTWRRGISGELDDDAAWGVNEVWLRIYPSVEERLRERYGAGGEPWTEVDGDRHERWYAQGLWHDLRGLPFEAQLRKVRRCRFRSRAFFDLLRDQSRQEGRKDRRRGVELAELALASLEGAGQVFGERAHDLRALGWAWLGNAHVLAFDFPAAEAAFEKADRAWRRDPLVLGDLRCFQGTLRTYQRGYGEALQLVEESCEAFRRAADILGEIRALVQQGAIHGYSGRRAAAIRAVSEAESLLADQKDPYLAFAVSLNLANDLAQAGRCRRASEKLVVARQSWRELDYPLGLHEITYVEGDIKQVSGDLEAAEVLYLAARDGFVEARERFCAARCSLDLMNLYSQQDRFDKVLELAPEAIAGIESINLHQETVAAVMLLSEAVAAGEVSHVLIQEARQALQLDPLTGLLKAK